MIKCADYCTEYLIFLLGYIHIIYKWVCFTCIGQKKECCQRKLLVTEVVTSAELCVG